MGGKKCCSGCGATTGCTCAAQSFTLPPETSFLSSLIPAVDQARDIHACLGLRAYTVKLVWTRWSGARRGEGVEEVTRVETLLPVPKVADLSALAARMMHIGQVEEGTLQISEISARYGEELLKGGSLEANEQFYYEIQQTRAGSPRRRFTVQGVPAFKPDSLEWTVTVVRAYSDRLEDGDPG